jgi:syntaxin 18
VKRRESRDESYDLFTKEAYRIYQHIDSLKRFLTTIRPVYLSTSNRPSTNHSKKSTDLNEGDSLFTLFSGHIQHLTDRERDEIDFQAKLIIRRCIDRIKELEEAEKIRQKNEELNNQKPLAILSHFLKVATATTEDMLFVHRSSITWFLNQKLMQVSQIQKDQQEIRLSRELEKSENQLSKSFYPPPPPLFQQQQPVEPDEPLDAFEQQLSNEQIQMLEKENSVMLEELNNTLNQIKNAEKALLEISTLQTQLTNHLAAQTIQTDRLYADAIQTTEKVEQGNLQLFSARERNKSSRKFMLAFLIGASFVLLFLDWYS